jgi:putative membrane protein
MMEYGMGWGWLGMILFWLIPILLVLVAIKYLFFGASRFNTGFRDDRNRALEVLQERYARGDIDREEFLKKRDDLQKK